jgi:hypothetical protein
MDRIEKYGDLNKKYMELEVVQRGLQNKKVKGKVLRVLKQS